MSLLQDAPAFCWAAQGHVPAHGLPMQHLQGAHTPCWPPHQGHEALEPPPCCKAAPRSKENVLPSHAVLVLSSPMWIPAAPSSER